MPDPGSDPQPAVKGARRRWLTALLILGAALGCIVLAYLVITFLQVWQASNDDEARAVDAIVVLGAAQYDGRPSPVLEARLEHALELYDAGYADLIVTTGANQPGDRFTQGFAGFEYLRNQGVPEDAILVVVDGTDTWEELSATANVLFERDKSSVLLVSDPYHNLRATAIAEEVGLEAYASAADTPATFRQLLRETAAVSIGRIIGFRRVSNLT